MGVSQFDRYAGAQYQGFRVPFQEMAMGAQAVQQRADNAEAQQQEAEQELIKAHALDVDVPRRNEIINNYKQKFNDIVQNEGGSYSKAAGKIKGLVRSIQNDMSTGELGAIVGNHNAHQQHVQGLNDMYKKGDISSEKRNDLAHMSLNDFKGTGKAGPTGLYNNYNGITAAKDVNIAKMAADMVNGWKADTLASKGYTKDLDGNYYKVSNHERVNPNEVYKHVYAALKDEPSVKAYLNQEADRHTYGMQDHHYVIDDGRGNRVAINPEVYKNNYKEGLLHNGISFAANKEGYDKIHEQRYVDPLAVHAGKKAMDKKDASASSGNYHLNGEPNSNINPDDVFKGTVLEGIQTKDGKIVVPTKSIAKPLKDKEGNSISPEVAFTSAGQTLPLEYRKAGNGTAPDTEKYNQHLAAIADLRAKNPQLAERVDPKNTKSAYKLSDAELLNLVTEARQASLTQAYTASDFGNLDKNKISQDVLGNAVRSGNFSGKKFKVVGKESDGTLDDLAKALKLDTKDLQKRLSTATIHGIVPTEGGAYHVGIYDGEGHPQDILMSGNDQQKNAYIHSTESSKLEKEGKTGLHLYEANGKHYAAVTQIVRTPEGARNITTTSQVELDHDGNILRRIGRPVHQQDLKRTEHEAFMNHPVNSKYLNKQSSDYWNVDESSNITQD
jgi:hypothetical protein